ncbi:MAG TPA: hypothetical protein VJU80_05455, partial [Solirubrobacteraceae bacterium]|nr:hypothetical protein [Solirubrobacteraceae bacterium]
MPLKSPALFRRIPVPRAASSCPLLPDGIEETEEYEALASDITFLREKLFGDFKSLDVSALESQNAFRRAQFLLI